MAGYTPLYFNDRWEHLIFKGSKSIECFECSLKIKKGEDVVDAEYKVEDEDENKKKKK